MSVATAFQVVYLSMILMCGAVSAAFAFKEAYNKATYFLCIVILLAVLL